MALEEVDLVVVLLFDGKCTHSHFLISKHLGDKEDRLVRQGPNISRFVVLVYVLCLFISMDNFNRELKWFVLKNIVVELNFKS